jgi:hypothetical protein
MEDKLENMYDKLMEIHENIGGMREHMKSIDEDMGAITVDISRINKVLRGNGTPGVITRLELVEQALEDRPSCAEVADIKARISERAKAADKKYYMRKYKIAGICAIVAAIIGGSCTIYAKHIERPAQAQVQVIHGGQK